ncbi:hypothetical protein LIER_09029 [Lithospermum erythrorhizon]|uniref:Reverse transcriptase zinc-binding domain-containing protein n=1 Tax=Lithospermum erythrorhizon TaxID=34254 RepID=A0AAV3PFH0_LITER
MQIGDDSRTSFWHDNWSNRGIMADVVSNETKKCLRIAENATVEEIILRGGWPTGRKLTRKVQQLKDDMPRNGRRLSGLKAASPRVALCVGCFFHGKLPTKDRLKRWGVCEGDKCIFIGEKENLDHLFFKCDYSSGVWRKILMYMEDYWVPGEWNEEGQIVMQKYKRKSFKSRLRKLCFFCVVYEIWVERNRSVFESINREVDCVVQSCIVVIMSRGGGFLEVRRIGGYTTGKWTFRVGVNRRQPAANIILASGWHR